jgi:DNA repair protein RecO (recombination protein O)
LPREQTYQAIIIKKQPFNEADEIITLLTQEAGKVRALAKSVKLGTSKLQQALQPIFLNNVILTNSDNLPKIINVQTINPFPVLQAHEQRVNVWFVMAELLNKALADEQPNPPLFALVVDYLQFLNTLDISDSVLAASLVKFKIQLMELIGLQLHAPSADASQSNLQFSPNRGGFYIGPAASDSHQVAPATWQAFNTLKSISFAAIRNQTLKTSQLQDLVNSFISYQLERELKAEKFLHSP